MTTLTAIDWDQWRADYPAMTFQDQREFYAQVADLFPVQQSHDLEACRKAFGLIGGENLCVVELGGWDGLLADRMMLGPRIVEWWNYDIAGVPQVCDKHGYHQVILEDWMWAHLIVGDVFVAAHTIEHLSREHLEELAGALETTWVYLEAPLAMRDYDWTGYPGSHMLEIGWNGVNEIMKANGYVLAGYIPAVGIMDEFGEQAFLSGLWRRA